MRQGGEKKKKKEKKRRNESKSRPGDQLEKDLTGRVICAAT